MVKILVPVFGSISLILFIYIRMHEKNTPKSQHLIFLSFGKKFPRVSYKDLEQATGSFSKSNLIGRGSYGSVYKGKLTQAKIEVAINVFDLEIRFAGKSFVSECEALRTIRHRNLVPVLTACSTIDNSGNDFKSLIYEFMPNGNLDTWLHQRHGGAAPKFLRLAQRIRICVDIADALAYLHHDCGTPIVHCDLKPTNILLDDDMNAYLGDFGIANLIVDSRSVAVGHSGCSNSLTVMGTIGYIAPGINQECRHLLLYVYKAICYAQNN
jgi:serine/threonine protein kinase